MKTFDPKNVLLIAGGHIISGYADGTFITVERDEDAFTKVSGSDGETTRSKSNNRGGKITIVLMQSSLSNNILSGFAIADELNNDGVVPILLKDSNGDSIHASGKAWVQKMPSSEYSKEVTNREWVMDCADLEMFVGGIANA